MKLLMNEELHSITPTRVLDSYAFLSSLASKFGVIIEGDLVASFVIKTHLRIFTTLCFVSAPDGEGSVMFTHKLPEFIRKNLPFVDMLVQPMATALFPVIANGGEGIPFGTYLIDLSVSEERLFEALHGKHRNVIKNAAKHNLIMAVGDEYIEEAHRIISAGYSKQGLSTYPLGYLKKMAQKLGPQFLVSVVIQNEKCVAAGLFYSDAIRTYYFLGGVSEQSVNGAMNFLLWETMRHYKSQGLLIFDLLGARLNVDQGSKYEGIQRFKERFGGSLISGYIWRYPLHTLKASVFYFLMRVRSFIKNGSFHADTIDQEAWKWR